MPYFSECDEYLTKVATAPNLGGKARTGWLTATLEDVPQAWKNMGRWGKAGIIAGGLGLTAAGALGAGHLLTNEQAGETYSYRVNRGLNSLVDRIKADEAIGGSFAKGLGSESSRALIGLTKDIVGKGYDTLKDTLQLSPVRSKILSAIVLHLLSVRLASVILPKDSVFIVSYKVHIKEVYGTLPISSVLYLKKTGKQYRFKTDIFIIKNSPKPLYKSMHN